MSVSFPDRLDADHAFAHLRRLAGDIGVRVAGTEQEWQGVDYLAEVFGTSGLEPITETFPIPVWQERRTELTVDGQSIPAISPCFGGRTGPEGIQGEFVAVGDPLRLEDLAGVDLAGKIALIDARNVYWDYPDYWQTDALLAAAAIGAIFVAGEHQLGGLPQAYYNYKRALFTPTPPSAIISWADAQRLAEHGGRASLAVEADVTWSESRTVLATLPGTDLADQTVIVSAHHDSTWTSPGASDNAGGCAIVAELARVFAAEGAPRRTIRFMQWGGHELGLMGSEAWIRANLPEMSQIAAVINFDGQGALEGADSASLLGSEPWMELARATLARLEIPVAIRVGGGGVDSGNFAAVGRNAINFSRFGEIGNHTPADNLDPLGSSGLVPGLQMSAALLSVAANVDFDVEAAPSPDQLQETQALCGRWGWGITG